MFKKVLIANRGEIALRVMQACRELGVKTVAVYSTADRDSLHALYADEAVCIGPPPSSESYLKLSSLIPAAEITGADAVHPGYGFLAENAHFAEVLGECSIGWIGPRPETIRLMGDKAAARRTAINAKVPTLQGSEGALPDARTAEKVAGKVGYPVILKAAAGGGGRGMRVVHRQEELAGQLATAREEAEKAFGDGSVYLEKYLTRPRHIEFQVFGDSHGNVIHLGERECSIQRRHQKLLEESPSPALDEDLRLRMGTAAVRLCQEVGYQNAGTIEFLLDEDGKFYFMEMNTRIQVEHPVTEMVSGVDLVRLQIEVAAGAKLTVASGAAGPRPRHRVPDQRRGPGALPPLPGPDHHLPCPRGPRRAPRHPRLRGLRHPAVLRLAGRQADRPRQGPARGHRPHGPGARVLRDRRNQDQHPTAPGDSPGPGVPRRRPLDPLHGAVPRGAHGPARAAGRRGARGRMSPLYAILDVAALGDRSPARAAALLARSGVGSIQLRAKALPDRRLHALALECRRAVEGTGAALWIDDRPDVAAAVEADGVHLGQHDLPPGAARTVVGPGCRIGLSTHDADELAAAAADPEVDLVAVGPVFPTRSKAAPDPVVGLDFVRRARAATTKPLVAIGGIDAGNLARVLAAGADAVAVLSALCRGDLEENLGRLLEATRS